MGVSERRKCRFNKIAIQGTPQMAVDKEALICLSRVYSYYFKCNFPLFYVYPALIPLSTAKTISNALISSRLDYCNSLINNIAKQDLSKLQRVHNCLARVILRAPRFSPSLPLLKQLHWLPVNYRIKFKLCTLTFRALAIHQPPYLASLLHFSNIPRQLRSSTSQQLSIPRTKLNLGKRAFSVAAPIIWNELPTTLKSCESLASFRKNLKTYLFKIVFPPAAPTPDDDPCMSPALEFE